MQPSQAQKDLHGVYAISPSEADFFQTNGYIKLKDVLLPASIEHYRQEVNREVMRLNTQHLPLHERDTYHRAFLQVENLWRHSDFVRELVMSSKLARIATDLLGVSGVRIYHDQALYKEAGGGVTPWHADQHYWPLRTDRTATAWIPLQDTPLDMGPLAFCQRSQLIRQGRELEIGDASEKALSQILKEHRVDETPFSIGEVSFHSGWTYHRAGMNKTGKPREVLTIIYMDQDMLLAEPHNKHQVDDRDNWCPGAQVGEVIDTPLNPVVWTYRA